VTVLPTLASVVCAAVPMLALLALVWWIDRYDREPVWLIATVFTWGAVGAILLALPTSMVVHSSLIQALTLVDAPMWLLERVAAVLVAPVAEEPAKGAVLALVVFNRHFDNMTDGFVYGAAAGLGFGMTENLWYFLSLAGDPAWGTTVVVRTFYSAVMHAMCTSVLGACVGHARFRRPVVFAAWTALGLLVAIAVHGTWNALASAPSEQLWMADLVLLPLEVLGVVLVFELCVWDESRAIQDELAEEAEKGLLPVEHPSILASWTRRSRHDWLPDSIDHGDYIRVATDLAMRKRQVRELGPRAPLAYRAEVELLRRELRGLLTTPAPPRVLPPE
jgi:RsiW-degrading membrane proteinase PrsW (M82 family)